MKCPVVALVVLLTISCGGSPTQPTTPIDIAVTVAMGESTQIAPAGATIRFDAVTEDSRCPADVYCVWAGRAGVRLAVLVNTSEQSIQLFSDPKASRTATVGGLRVEWVQLEPYPRNATPTQPGDYRITIRVVR